MSSPPPYIDNNLNSINAINVISAPPLSSNEISAKSRHILINVDDTDQHKNMLCTFMTYLLPRFFSYGSCALTAYWIYQSYDGIRLPTLVITNGTGQLYYPVLTYHILGMSVFAMITNQEAILSKISPFLCSQNECIKGLSYYGSQLIGLASAGLGFAAIYYKNSLSPETDWFSYHLYSPHAWMGISTAFVWIIRQCTGLCMPKYIKLNEYLSRSAYLLGLATCALGFQSKQTIDLMTPSSLITNSSLTNITNATVTNVTNVTNVLSPNSWFSVQPSLSTLLIAASAMATIWAIL